MIEEAMKAVKEAETKADDIVRNAHREAEELHSATLQKIREARTAQEAASEKKQEDALAKAKEAGQAEIAAARETAAKEAEALKAVAAEKEESAIQAVISALIPE